MKTPNISRLNTYLPYLCLLFSSTMLSMFPKADQMHFFSFSPSVFIYVDGEKTRPDLWLREGLCSITFLAKRSYVLAVRLTSPKRSHRQSGNERPHGFILSISQHILTQEYSATDQSWKCVRNLKSSGKPDDGSLRWYESDFDDHEWSSANVSGKNGEPPWGVVEGIASHANWITAKNSSQGDTIYCRGVLSSKPDTLTIASAGFLRVFADGQPRSGGVPVCAKKLQLPFQYRLAGGESHLVAVHVRLDPDSKSQPSRGLISSLSMFPPANAAVDVKWRCKSTLSADEEKDDEWARVKMADQKWPAARTLGNNGDDPWGAVLDISASSKWIWDDSDSDEVYCRGLWSPFASDRNATRSLCADRRENYKDSRLDFNPLPIYPTHPPVMDVPELTAATANFTWEQFFKNFLVPGRPFKLKSGVIHWPALRKWTDKYLNTVIGDESTEVLLAPDNSERYYFYSTRKRRVEMKVSTFLETYSDPNRQHSMYLIAHGLTEDGSITSPLAHDFDVPQWAKNLDLTEDGANLWMGLGPQITPAHFDNVENFMCVVAGRKRFRLYEPAMTNYLYPETHDRSTSITSRIENLSNPDLKKFPEAANLRAVFVDLEAGDLLFIPAYWWHEVTSYDRNVAVNMWFKSHSTLLDSIHTAWCEALPQSQWGLEQERKRNYKQIRKERQIVSEEEEEEEDERTLRNFKKPDSKEHDEL